MAEGRGQDRRRHQGRRRRRSLHGARPVLAAVKVKVADTVGAGDTFTRPARPLHPPSNLLDKKKLAVIAMMNCE